MFPSKRGERERSSFFFQGRFNVARARARASGGPSSIIRCPSLYTTQGMSLRNPLASGECMPPVRYPSARSLDNKQPCKVIARARTTWKFIGYVGIAHMAHYYFRRIIYLVQSQGSTISAMHYITKSQDQSWGAEGELERNSNFGACRASVI